MKKKRGLCLFYPNSIRVYPCKSVANLNFRLDNRREHSLAYRVDKFKCIVCLNQCSLC